MAKEKKTKKGVMQRLITDTTKLLDRGIGAAPTAFFNAMRGERGTWKGKDIFNKDEHDHLRNVAAKQLAKGQHSISYKDLTPKGGAEIGYGMPMPNLLSPKMNVQYTLGKSDIVRRGEDVLVADEYDFPARKIPTGMTPMNKVKTIVTEVATGKISPYGFLHLTGEAFGPHEGGGPSIRVDVGTAKSLGLSKDQMSKIPTLREYEAKHRGRINPKNIRKGK